MATTSKKKRPTGGGTETGSYSHPTAEALLRPDVGTQAHFRKKKPPATYRYDSSLDPELSWDGGNAAREHGEALIRRILEAEELDEAKAAARELQTMSRPFLNWTGKAERLSFEVPTLPLFIHERLSTRAVLETLKGHKRDKQLTLYDLFADRQHPIHEQVLKAYEYKNGWVNRLILGDSVVVMSSLLHYEGLGGQVQMIYMDPPYGVKFGSNFQPFVRQRDVRHGSDEDMIREPETVKAYRDTWELGTHSYLTYLRDRLLLARELLSSTGSIFLQINDENVHHVREILDEVFGASNFVSQINFQTTTGFETKTLSSLGDYLLWYSKDQERLEVNKLFRFQTIVPGAGNARWLLLPDGKYRTVSAKEIRGESPIPKGARLYSPDNLISQGASSEAQPFEYDGRSYLPPSGTHWKANWPEGLNRLASAGRIHVARNSIRFRRFADDFPFERIGNIWTDTLTGSFTANKIYAVQTNTKVVERCILLTTKPGELVLDPTCGSGTTAYVSEQWGRRWITIDTSRVPLALARQRLLTATFPYYELKEPEMGPVGGFVFRRRQNNVGIDIGGIVPHITLESIANNEPAIPEVLFDRPEVESKITRVTGPFAVEATIPTPIDWNERDETPRGPEIAEEVAEYDPQPYGTYVDRMLEVLRRSPVIHLGGGRTVTLENVRMPTKSLSLSAEAKVVGDSDRPVAIVFGPENGAISEKLVFESAREAHGKSYAHLYAIGFAIQPNARKLVEECEEVVGVPATYVQATPDLMMGDLLKNMRSSQIFSVCGLPDVKLRAVPGDKKAAPPRYQVELVGLDVFDPATMELDQRSGDDVPCWFLDADYNGLCFHVSQAFFPRTSAWDNLRRSLKGEFDDEVWEHLSGVVSEPFEAGDHGQVAVKVIDDRGNELLVVKDLSEAES